jgi:hypothetical protein
MKKLLALALVGAFACVAYAGDDKKPAEKSCKMECCKKDKKACADCADCKAAMAKKDGKKG